MAAGGAGEDEATGRGNGVDVAVMAVEGSDAVVEEGGGGGLERGESPG